MMKGTEVERESESEGKHVSAPMSHIIMCILKPKPPLKVQLKKSHSNVIWGVL